MFDFLEGASQWADDGKPVAEVQHVGCLTTLKYVQRGQHTIHVQAGFRLAPSVMRSLLADYNSRGSEATSLQPQIANAAAAFLKLAKTALLSKQ